MIELTERQLQAMGDSSSAPLHLVDPRTQERYVLLPVAEYERLRDDEYDDAPWTTEERHALTWEAGKRIGWEEMDEYDDIPERP